MLFGQLLYDRGLPSVGSLDYQGFESREECALAVAESAYRTNMKPPPKWMWWRCHWPADVMVEYSKLAAK